MTNNHDIHTEGPLPTTRLLSDTLQAGDESVDVSITGGGAKMAETKTLNRMTLRRNVYTQQQLEETYVITVPPPTMKEKVHRACACSKDKVVKRLQSYFPIIGVLRDYAWRSDLLHDFTSGISVSFIQMPMGMALGLLASLPPIFGLYTTFFATLFYLLFGTSRHVSMGTNALLSLLTANVVERELTAFMAAGAAGVAGQSMSTTAGSTVATTTSGVITGTDSTLTTMMTTDAPWMSQDEQDLYKVGVATSLSFIAGIILLAMGLLRFGFITSFLSTSFLGGFTTAAAVHIFSSQIPKIIHIKVPPLAGVGKLVRTYINIFKNIGDTNPADLIIGLISVAVLLAVMIFINEKYQKQLKVPVPIHLILVIISTLISQFAELKKHFGIAIVGTVSTGFLAPAIPPTNVISNIATEAFVIAIMAYAMTISMAKLMAKQHSYKIDDNQELVAYGICNFLGAFFRCHPNCTAPPRTMLLSNTGARSTLNGVFTAAFILIVIMAAGQLFTALPIAVLAAMIMTAVKNLLLQVTQLPNLWRVSKPDFTIWLSTFLVGVFADLDYAIIAGIGLSVFSVVVFSQMTSSTVGGVSQKEDLVLSNNRAGVKNLSGVKIFYFPAQLYFANAEKFKNDLYGKVLNPDNVEVNAIVESDVVLTNFAEKDKEGVSNGNGIAKKGAEGETVKAIIIDCSAMTYIDLAGVNIMKLIFTKYSSVGVKVFLARCPDYPLGVLDRAGFFVNVSRDCIVVDVYDALSAPEVEAVSGWGTRKTSVNGLNNDTIHARF
ncbi:sulfate transporter [Aplysia californica]|uniref:Sulfate transporter n=1 Tax=Aplysia californica TaxID=6500 RepID=A0ABM0ZZQ8_APLCA|nr:sulfate transporter [Aplysia californica]